LISQLKQNENQIEMSIQMMQQNKQQSIILRKTVESVRKQQELIISQLMKRAPDRIKDIAISNTKPPPTPKKIIPEKKIPKPDSIFKPSEMDKETTICRLEKNTILYSKNNKQSILVLKSPLIAKLITEPEQSEYYKIYFHSWVIESYKRRKLVSTYPNNIIKVLYNLNTRAKPRLRKEDLIGTIQAGQMFHLEQQQVYDGNNWLEIRIDALVHENDIR